MGFFTRLLVPRKVRRAVHPVRAVKRAVTPKPIKNARRALHPLDNAVYGLERSLTTKPRKRRRSTSTSRTKGTAPVFNHGSCGVNHRSAAAAAKCRNR
jgi:hypothetical protein